MKGLTRTTSSLRPAAVEKHWIVVDAENAILGRLASFIALRLRGKHRPDYTPNVDCGDFVVVVNVDKVKLTGKKLNDKKYYRHTGHPGGIKVETPKGILGGRFPERVLQKAVERMMPKESPLARKQLTHLLVYAGPEHCHQAQQPYLVDFVGRSEKNTVRPPVQTSSTAHLLRNTGPGIVPADRTTAPSAPARPPALEETPTPARAPLLSLDEAEVELGAMILELDDAPRIADALSRIRQMLLTLEINEALHRPTFRRLLRRLPDRLLQAVGENVGQPDLAKAAATALVVAMNPQDYGPEVSEKRALADFSRVIKTTGLHSIAKIDVKGSAAQAELKIRIWTQLPFKMAGQVPELAAAPWHDLDNVEIEVSGANLVSQNREDDLPEVALSATAALTPVSTPRAGKAVIYIKNGDTIVDHFIYDYGRLFPGYLDSIAS